MEGLVGIQVNRPDLGEGDVTCCCIFRSHEELLPCRSMSANLPSPQITQPLHAYNKEGCLGFLLFFFFLTFW